MELDYEKLGEVIAENIKEGLSGDFNMINESLNKIAFCADNTELVRTCTGEAMPAVRIDSGLDINVIGDAILELNETLKKAKGCDKKTGSNKYTKNGIRNFAMDILSTIESELHYLASENGNDGFVHFDDINMVLSNMVNYGVDKRFNERFGK